MSVYDTFYGRVTIGDDSVKLEDGRTVTSETTIEAIKAELYAWANRPGERWPCSALEDCHSIRVTFDSRGDLVDLEGDGEVELLVDELNAWSSDVLRDAGFLDHPAIR